MRHARAESAGDAMTTETGAAAAQMAEQKPPADEDHWTVDKRIPLALIVGMVFQAAAFTWWGAKLDSRVEAGDARIAKLESRDGEQRTDRERMIRLEERLIAMLDEQRRMNGKLELLLDERRQPK